MLQLSKVKELFNTSNGSTNSRRIAEIANARDEKMNRYFAAKCMEVLGLVSYPPPDNSHKRGNREHDEIENLLDIRYMYLDEQSVGIAVR